MKITCKQQDLSRGLSVVSHAVSSRSTLPILANILLTTEGGRLKLSATNLEIGINTWIDAEVIQEGKTTLPARLFSDFVNSLPQAQVEIVVDENHSANVKSLRSSANIKGANPEEYPNLPSIDTDEKPVVFDASVLKEVIAQVAMAAAPDDDSRPVFTGVHVEILPETITFAAADSFRLAVRTIPFPENETIAERKLLIPARTLTELARILPAEGSVEMVVTPNGSQVLFHTAQVDLVSRLIEGTFPNFRAIIPERGKTRVIVPTKEFAAAVKSVNPFARDSSNIARVKVMPGGNDGLEPGALIIEATAEDVGSNVSSIVAQVEGEEQQIILNNKYLGDVLSVIGTEEVALEVTSPTRPGVIKPVGGGNYTYVIMPMSTAR